MKLKLLSSILTLCFFGMLSAQNYPVTVVPQAVSPSPIYLSSYADAGTVNSPLRVQLLLNDITLSNVEVRLKTYFEGNGIRFESNNAVVGANPIYLEGGVPVNLTNIQLAPFYSLQNISGINSNQYAEPIPEGSYQFCFEVYDAFTGNRLSARSCATTYIFKNEPPFLILPRRDETIDVINPQNIVFQWTPRHINVSNVEYELSIVEIWDNYVDPQAAFFSMPPIFQATTRNTSYLLGPADPMLLPNKKYAWRVQAKAIAGTEEIGLFNNNGYSEIFWFSHSQPCEVPANVRHEVKGTHQANIEWDDFSTEIPEYKVRYRDKNSSPQGAWFYSRSNTNWVTIWDLRPGTTYEYQVNRKCQLIESEYSPVKTFTTFLADDESGLYNCGISPEINITNADPLPDLFVNDVFKAGDFPIKVLEVSGSNGRFAGKGYVSMPYLKNIKVAVEFTNVLINTDKNLIEGMVITKYDPTWSNILDTDGVIDSVEDIADVFTGGDNTILDPVEYDIESVTIKDGQIVVTGTNGEQTTYDYDEGDTYQISGANGVFAIDENGNVSQIGETAEGGPATAENTEGINPSGNGTIESPSVAQVYTEGATVIFRKGSETKYELDMVDNSFEQSTYPKAKRSDGKDYYPVHKAVVNGNKDVFYADITITNNEINIDSLVFKTMETGLKLVTEKVDNDTYKIEVQGRNAYRNEEAIITYKDATGKQIVLASFFIHHLHKLQTRKVQIVSVNGASPIEGLEETLNTVFGVAGASFDVNSDIHEINISPSVWDIDEKNDVLDYNGSGLLPDYPKEIRAIHQYYMANTANYDSKAYYLFLVDETIKVSKPINGFMPKGRQFGYVFNAYKNQGLGAKEEQSKVAAHELGHGVFSLEHPFESDSNAGNTQWLMDYNANGTQLPFTHWVVMSETGLNLQLFQPDEGGEYGSYQYLIGYNVVPGEFKTHINDFSDESMSFISPAGKIMSIPSVAKDVTFMNKGALYAFTITENGKEERYVGVRRVKDGSDYFAGYVKRTGIESDWKERVFRDEFSKNLPENVTVYLGKLKKENNNCGIDLYKKAFLNKADKNDWNSGGNNELIVSTDFTSGLTPIKANINSPEACDLCNDGEKFFNNYIHLLTNTEDKNNLNEISKFLCSTDGISYENLLNQINKESTEIQDNLFWKSDKALYQAARQRFWESENALSLYLKALQRVHKNINYYKENLLKSEDITLEDIYAAIFYLNDDFLETLNVNQKITILESVFEKDFFITSGLLGIANDDESLIMKILNSVKNEEAEAKSFLEALLATTNNDNEELYEKLAGGLDDNGGYDDNFSNYLLKLVELSNTAYRSNQKSEIALSLVWGAENKEFILKFTVPITDYTFDYSDKKVKVTGICHNETQYAEYGVEVTRVCEINKRPLEPFKDFVQVVIIDKAGILPVCNNQQSQLCGRAIIVPAIFLEYVQTKLENQKLENFGMNVITVVGTIASGGELATAKVGTAVWLWAAGDLTYTISNAILVNVKDELIANTSPEFAKAFYDGWGILGQIFIVKGGYDITKAGIRKITRSIAASKVMGDVEFYAHIRKSLQEQYPNLSSSQLDEQVDHYKSLIKQLEKEIPPGQLAEEIEAAKGLLKGGSFSQTIKNNLFKRLDEFPGENYSTFRDWINGIEDSNLLSKLEDLTEDLPQLGKDFDKLKSVVDLTDTEILSAWSSVSKSPVIRAKPQNLEILKKVHSRFEYEGQSSFYGLNKLLNEGSAASKQKLIDGLEKVNNIFDSSLPVKFSGIKAGEVKVIGSIDGKGDEVARIIDNVLEKKKFLEDGEVVGKYEGDDILKKGDEVGFFSSHPINDVFHVGDKILDISIKQIKKGTNGKIAIIGRSMGNAKVTGVKNVYSELKNVKKLDVEIFDASSLEGIWKTKFDDAVIEFSQKTDKWTKKLTNQELLQLKMYKLNKEWAQKLIDEGYTILDLGDFNNLGFSAFYSMEKLIIFK